MYLAWHDRVEQQCCRLQLEVCLGIRQLAFAGRGNERPAQRMVVATYRIHSKANHVNVVTTEIEGTVGIQLKRPSGVDCAENIEQKVQAGNINVDEVMCSLDIITNDDWSIHIKVKRSAGVVLRNQRCPIVFDTEAQKATTGIVDLKANSCQLISGR